MNLATLDDLKDVMKLFQKHKDIFPHIRQDYVKREIEKGNVIYQDGVVIIYGIYQRKQKIGTVWAKAGDAHIGQIVSSGIPLRASFILNMFFNEMKRDVWLTVRLENRKACKFYTKNGMKHVSAIFWVNGTLPGLVYKKEYDETLL